MHVEMRPQVNERETYSPPPSGEGSLLHSAEGSQLDAVTQVLRFQLQALMLGLCCSTAADTTWLVCTLL